MRIISSFVVFSIVLLSSGWLPKSLPVHIKGQLKSNPKYEWNNVDNLQVLVKGDGNLLAKAITKKGGNFEITFTSNKEKYFEFYCTGLGIDTLLLECVTSFESDSPEMIFYLPANYRKNVLGQVICIKCNKADKVYKIVYNNSPIVTRIVNSKGDTSYSPLNKGKYYAGCIAGPAKYYCDRDHVKF